MSDADKAYALAEQLIEEARQRGTKGLKFDREKLHALERLPPSIGELSQLEWLDLDHTNIAILEPVSKLGSLQTLHLNYTRVIDLTPLSNMSALRVIYLCYTEVQDLEPLSNLKDLQALFVTGSQVLDLTPVRFIDGLVNPAGLFGLHFGGCAAARLDPRIAEIAEIEASATRAQTLFAYLENWVPPEGLVRPAQDALLPVDLAGERLEIPASLPTEAEREERLKQVLHKRLCSHAKSLAQAAGNRFPRLADRARALDLQVAAEFAELDLLMLHLAVEDLQFLNNLGREDDDGEVFPSEVTLPLDDVVRLGPGLTLGHPDVDLLVERRNTNRASDPVPAAELATQNQMSRAVAADDAAIGPHLRQLEGYVAESSTADAKVAQIAANRNVLWRIAGVASVTVMGALEVHGAVADVHTLSPAVSEFLAQNFQLLHQVAALYGPDFYNWFAGAVAQVGQAKGISLTKPHRPPR